MKMIDSKNIVGFRKQFFHMMRGKIGNLIEKERVVVRQNVFKDTK